MTDECRKEFKRLNGYRYELQQTLTTETTMPIRRLLKIADHIKVCDYLSQTSFEKELISTSVYYWEQCAKQWIKNKVDQKNAVQPQPRKTWEEVITKNDEAFLRQLYAGKEPKTPSPNNNKDRSA